MGCLQYGSYDTDVIGAFMKVRRGKSLLPIQFTTGDLPKVKPLEEKLIRSQLMKEVLPFPIYVYMYMRFLVGDFERFAVLVKMLGEGYPINESIPTLEIMADDLESAKAFALKMSGYYKLEDLM